MLTQSDIETAGRMLWEAWRRGEILSSLPEAIRPATREEGYAIQAAIEGQSAKSRLGWKIAATSAAGQTHLQVDGPLAGRLLREGVIELGEELTFGRNRMRVAEAEFAFRMGAGLPPRSASYTAEEVLAAAASLHPAIEIPDTRYEEVSIVGAPQLIADNACAHGFVLGPPAPPTWRSMDLAAHQVLGSVAGKGERVGIGSNVLGSPVLALAWLANELSGIGIGLQEGEIVTTGTCIVPIPIEPFDRVTCDFGVLGKIELLLGGVE